MRLGIDLGGTKTEIIALDDGGVELYRKRVPSNSDRYEAVIATMADLVREAERALGRTGTVGVGIPGTISARTGLVKNANTVVLNGRALDKDLGAALGRTVRCANDANCLAASEAADGAGAGHRVVFAAILGTGCGAGVALDGRCWAGPHLVAGEWGHNPLPWMDEAEYPGADCWCGQKGCIETWISGTGFARDYALHGGEEGLKGPDIIARAAAGDAVAGAALERYMDRLGRCLAHVVNILDPDIIVLGGGMSRVDALYERVPVIMRRYVFGGEADTPIRPGLHGDSSGVRGAAWLWPAGMAEGPALSS